MHREDTLLVVAQVGQRTLIVCLRDLSLFTSVIVARKLSFSSSRDYRAACVTNFMHDIQVIGVTCLFHKE